MRSQRGGAFRVRKKKIYQRKKLRSLTNEEDVRDLSPKRGKPKKTRSFSPQTTGVGRFSSSIVHRICMGVVDLQKY